MCGQKDPTNTLPVDDPRDTDALSETQRTLLETAIEEGYFEVPRRVSLVDLADEQDLSDRQASQELRHGVDALLRAHFDT